MKLSLLGLIVFIGTVVYGLPATPTLLRMPYANSPQLMGPKVNWAYWINDGSANKNQEHQKTNFADVDCVLNKNIIFHDFQNVNFGQDFVYEWTDDGVVQEFLTDLAVVQKRCPDVRVVIDPQIVWDQELAEQVIQKKVSVSKLAKSITDFTTKYYLDGLVLSFNPEVVLNDKLTYEFMKELKRQFTQNKLQLLLAYGHLKDLSYVRPVAFEFADLIITYTDVGYNGNVLEHEAAAFGSDTNNLNALIDAFVNMGAHKSQISVFVYPHGISSKRVNCQEDVEAGCPSEGFGSVIYLENSLFVKEKNYLPQYHDRSTVCRVTQDPEWTKKYDEAAQVPYAFNSEQWLTYDDEQSIKVKIDLIKEKGIAGVTIYPLNFDDVYNSCGYGAYSFTRKFVDGLKY
jgi:hypothetical protein